MRSPITLLRFGIENVFSRPSSFVLLYVPVLLAALALMPFEPGPNATMDEVLRFLVLMIPSFIVSLFYSVAVIKFVAEPGLTPVAAYQAALPYIFRYVGLAILLTIILLGGYILLIIPGIIFSVWFAFAYLVLITEDTGVTEALKKSRNYVRGRWWGVFGRLVALILISLVFVLGLAVLLIPLTIFANPLVIEVVNLCVSAIVAPIAVSYSYALYQDLASPANPTTESATPTAADAGSDTPPALNNEA